MFMDVEFKLLFFNILNCLNGMFDWNGLGDRKHFILVQNPDPLEYCTYSLPFPTSLGIPCAPCDLPN